MTEQQVDKAEAEIQPRTDDISEVALADWLAKAFSPSEFDGKILLSLEKSGRSVRDWIPPHRTTPPGEYFQTAVQEVQQHGYLNLLHQLLIQARPERSPEINALWGHEPDLGNNQPIITLVQNNEAPTGLFVGVGAILVGIVATFTFPFRTVFPLWGRPAFYLLLTLGSFLIVIELLSPKKTRDRYYELIWQTSHVDTWSKRLLASFDEAFAVVFGKKYWSLRCFLGSVTVTTLSVFFLVVMPDILLAFFYSPTPFGHIIKVLGRLLGLFGLITAITFLFDFISLWWTRSLMTRVAHRGFGVIFLALILDFALTFALGLLPGVATYQSLFAYFRNNNDVYKTFITLIAIEPFAHASVVTFITGFFTSVWLWGQMAVVGTARGLSALKPIGQLLSELSVAKHPLSAAVGLSGFGTALLPLERMAHSPAHPY